MKEVISVDKIIVPNFRGFGVSLLEDSNTFIRNCNSKSRKYYLEKVFGKDGLNLTSVRYTLSGGDNPKHNHITAENRSEGYQEGENKIIIETKDKYQRWLLLESIRMGVKRIHGYCTSPPYWMTKSKCSSGSCNGTSNLRREYFEEYINYITKVLNFFKSKYKIEFDTFSATNEPLQEWWVGECSGAIDSISRFERPSGTSEGCNFSSKDQIVLNVLLKKELKELKTRVGVSDEASIPKAIKTIKEFKLHNKISTIQTITVHSNWGSIKDRQDLKDIAKEFNKEIIMSEWGGILDKGEETELNLKLGGGIGLARHICNDINNLGCTEWILKSIHPNLIEPQPKNDCSNVVIKKQYYIYKHFTYFIKEKYAIIKADNSSNILIATDGNKLIIVVVNEYKVKRQVSINVENLVNVNLIDTFVTNEERNFERTNDNSYIEYGIIHIKCEKHSIYTLELSITNDQLYYCMKETLLRENIGNINLQIEPYDKDMGTILCNKTYKKCKGECFALSIQEHNKKQEEIKYAKFELPNIPEKTINASSHWDCIKGSNNTFIKTINSENESIANETCNKIEECRKECIVAPRKVLIEGFECKRDRSESIKKYKKHRNYILKVILLIITLSLLYIFVPNSKIREIQ